MTYYFKNGNTFKITPKEAVDLYEQLPPGNYVVKEDAFKNLYLESVDGFEFKGKRYGDNNKNAKRILNTYMNRDVSTGVLLTGEKGSGKTLLAKTIAMEAAKQNTPTIIVNAPFTGDRFNTFIQSIEQPCVIMFDEFEKVYDKEDQESILTLLDGVYPSKKLFILTCNDKWRVDSHMRNRPGRIFYMLDFSGLDIEFVIEYCQDNLKNKKHIDGVCRISSLFDKFNFDMLKALIEEMNRYDESPQEAMRMLNAKPEFDSGGKFEISIIDHGVEIPKDKLHETEWNGNPLGQNAIGIGYYLKMDESSPLYDELKDEIDDDGEVYRHDRFQATDLVSLDSRKGIFTFSKDNNVKVTLTRTKTRAYDYLDF